MLEQRPTPFEQRFQGIVAKMRMTHVMTVISWTALTLTVALAVMSCLDYFLETNWAFRATIFAVAVLAATCISISLILQALRRWNRSATAAQVEQRFQDLGQSVRTSVQLNHEDPKVAGVSPSLLDALHQDVAEKTHDLRLTEAVSTGPLRISIALLGVMAVITLAACATSWDWRMATMRTLLGNKPYTTVKVGQGDARVDEKATFTLNTQIGGRTHRKVKLLTRGLDGETWEARPITKQDETATQTRLISYQVSIPKVKQPFEYQVVAGKYASPVHRVDVRYPLAIEAFHIELTAPEYTGLATKTINKGSFDSVQGAKVKLGIQLDHAPQKAWLELRPIVTPLGENPEIETVDLTIDGVHLTADLVLKEDRLYQVFAEAVDGTKLRPNRFRIRVHEDRAPKLAFQKPDQLVEVHPLAELLMRLRVSDDYGLRRAGIVFQLNNEPEITLEEFEYDDLVTSDGELTPQTKALIESRLPLEYFEMTVKDSICYYAFAEDNRPGQANLNETDLQFIDVRPFRRLYPVPEEGQSLRGMGRDGNSDQRNLPALDEMIQRERFVLNRTMQMKRRDDRAKSIDANSIDNLIGVQNETSEFAGQLGDEAAIIEQVQGIPEEGRISDLMYAAQDAMLASVDSLASLEFDVARLQELDALQHLLDARQRLDEAASQGGNGGFSAFRNASRRLMNRMRRPRTNQERAREIVRRLKRAAAEQEFLMEKISDLVPPEMPETEGEQQSQEDEALPEDDTGEEATDEDLAAEDDAPSLDELRRELEKEQSELAEDVRDIVDMIEELNQVSPLAQQRTQRVTSNADGVVGALERGDSERAIATAESASAAFRMLADNIAGITADEATRRLEIARDLGILLTDELRDLENELASAQKSADESDLDLAAAQEREVELAKPLSRSAAQQAEIAKTINDVLNSIVDPEQGIPDTEDRMVKRLQEIMQENKLEESIGRMQLVSEVIDSLAWSDAGIQAGDLGDRFDIVSQRLGAMHREMLAPRVEQLRMLETRAVDTKQQLTGLQTEDQVNRWHLRADGLMDDIESAKVAENQVEKVRQVMEAAGWGAGGEDPWNWETGTSGTALAPPTEYEPSLAAVLAEIQRHIRELSMLDMDITNSGAVPPKYKQFVERYFEVLSGANPDAAKVNVEGTDE